MVIGDHFFQLDITMEKFGLDGNGDEVEFDFGDDDGGGQGKEGENAKEKEEDNPLMPEDPMDQDNNALVDSHFGHKSLEGYPISEDMLRNMADGTTVSAVGTLTTECAGVVVGEDDGEIFDGMVQDVDSEDDSGGLSVGDAEMTGDEQATAQSPPALTLDVGAAADAPGASMEGTGSLLVDGAPGKGCGLLDSDAEETDFATKIAALLQDDSGLAHGSGSLRAASAGTGQTNLQVQ